MFAKIFTQILDSSIAEDYQVRHTFEDMLKLCDVNGVVDMTHESIARRLNVPLEIIVHCIGELEKPDADSRTKDHEGRRIVRVDDHRDWGWFIVNYDYYRNLASEEQRREKTKTRTQKWRKKRPETRCDAPVTQGDARDAMQREREMEKETAGAAGLGSDPVGEWENARTWLKEWQKHGADYTEFEARTAFLALQAGGWMWGRNPITDPRAALERQIQTDRQRNTAKKPPVRVQNQI